MTSWRKHGLALMISGWQPSCHSGKLASGWELENDHIREKNGREILRKNKAKETKKPVFNGFHI